MRAYITAVALILISGAANACGTDETEAFSCMTTNGNVAQVCQASDSIRYSFGRPDAVPEMTVRVPNERFVWHSDGGSAMDIIELNFDNSSTRYVVSATRFWRGDVELDSEIRVEQGDRQLAMLRCDVETVRLNEKAIAVGKTPY